MFTLTYRLVGFPEVEVVDGVWSMSEAFHRAEALALTGEVFETAVAPADPGDFSLLARGEVRSAEGWLQ